MDESELTGADLEAYIRTEMIQALWRHQHNLIIFGGEEGLAQHERRKYLVSFLRGIADAADHSQIGDIRKLQEEGHISVNVARVLVNGDLLREAADEFESLFQPSTETTPSYDYYNDKYEVTIVPRDFQGQTKDDWHATVTRMSDGKKLVWISDHKWLLKWKVRRKAIAKHFRLSDERERKMQQKDVYIL